MDKSEIEQWLTENVVGSSTKVVTVTFIEIEDVSNKVYEHELLRPAIVALQNKLGHSMTISVLKNGNRVTLIGAA